MPLRHFLANAFFSALLEPGSGLEDMILQMKGIALKYAIVRYSLSCDECMTVPVNFRMRRFAIIRSSLSI